MTDDEFVQVESEAKDALYTLKRACYENGYEFKERADDLVYMVENDE